MRFKLDENLGRSVADVFRKAGHDTSTVVDQGLTGADDRRVFDVCAAEDRVLVTLDLDFANPLVFDPRRGAGIVVLRLPKDHGPADIAEAATLLLETAKSHDITGSLWVVARRRVRRFVHRDEP